MQFSVLDLQINDRCEVSISLTSPN